MDIMDIELIKISKYIVFDLETTSLDPRVGEIRGVAIATENGEWWFPEDTGKSILQVLALDESKCLIAHNMAFDLKWIVCKWKIFPRCQIACTMIGAFLLDENYKHYGLKHLVSRFFDYQMATFEEISEAESSLFAEKDGKYSLGEYSKIDAKYTLKLFNTIYPFLENDGLIDYFFKVEMVITKTIIEMELNGISIDSVKLNNYDRKLRTDLEVTCNEIYALCGKKFLITSSKEVAKLLFSEEHYAYPVSAEIDGDEVTITTIGKNGYYGTDESVLNRLLRVPNPKDNDSKFVMLLLEHRRLSKTIDSFTTPFSEIVGKSDDCKIHSSFHQVRTVTGRIVSAEPNLQQVTTEGELRSIFIPEEGRIFIGIDYSQVELRILAHLSREPKMIETFLNNGDIHATTQKLLGLKDRITAKTCNFGVIYGQGAKSFAEKTKTSVKSAYKFIENFYKEYSYIKKYQDYLKGKLLKGEPLKILGGRLRRLKIDGSMNEYKKGEVFRQYFNSAIQGCQHIDTLICTDKGYVPIKFISPKTHTLIQEYGDNTNSYIVHNVGVKDGFLLKTYDGDGIYSNDHRFMCYKNGGLVWKKLSELLTNDVVAIDFNSSVKVGFLPNFSFKHKGYSYNSKCYAFREITTREVELLGILIGDGSYSSKRSQVSVCGKKEYMEWIVVNLIGPVYNFYPKILRNNSSKGECYRICINRKGIRKRLLQLGLCRVKGALKSIPEWIYSAPPEYKIAFIRGLFDTDGGISGDSYGFCNKSKNVVEGLSRLLLDFGLSHQKYTNNAYRIRFRRDMLLKFNSIVGSDVVYKKKYLDTKNESYSIIPHELARDIAIFVSKRHGRKVKFTYAESSLRHKLEHYGGCIESCTILLDKMYDSDKKLYYKELLNFRWTKIKNIESVGKVPMMDIEIFSKNHSYISNGFVVHNSASNIIKMAMRDIYDWIATSKIDCIFLLQVHDELLFSVPESSNVYTIYLKIVELMENVMKLRVPLVVDGYIGHHWVKKMKCGKCGAELDLKKDIVIKEKIVYSKCCNTRICNE